MKKVRIINNETYSGGVRRKMTNFPIGFETELEDKTAEIWKSKGYCIILGEQIPDVHIELTENQLKQLDILKETKELKRKYNKKDAIS